MMKSGSALIKRRSGVNPKRLVRVYEDSENPEPGKRMKTNSGAHAHLQDQGKLIKDKAKGRAPMGTLGRQRRPLADINNVGAGAVKKGDDLQKSDAIKKASEGGCTGLQNSSYIEPVAKKQSETQTTRGKLVTEQNDPKTAEISKEPEVNVSTSIISVNATQRIQQQNNKVFTVPYYGTKIYKYLFAIEKRFEVPKNHLEGQVLNGLMRAVLVDWLAGMADNLDLTQETFQLTVYIVDKYMSINKTTTTASAQLVGLGALFVASKYEETETIDVDDLIFFSDNKWNGNDIKSMECTILKTVNYQLGKPLAIHFIRRLSRISGASPMEHSYAKYFADTSLLSYQICHIKPSMIAAASVFLAFCVSKDRIDTTYWTPNLVSSSTYKLEDFKHLLPLVARAVTQSVTGGLEAIHSRYSSSNLFCVSRMPGCKPETGIINHF